MNSNFVEQAFASRNIIEGKLIVCTGRGGYGGFQRDNGPPDAVHGIFVLEALCGAVLMSLQRWEHSSMLAKERLCASL